MDWYVTTGVGAKPIGPVPEEQVIAMIRAGMKIVGAHAKGAEDWIAPETHPPFAMALGAMGDPSSVAEQASSTKRCPFCAEEIQLAAVRCKHCQADLSGAPQKGHSRTNEALGIVMLVTPLLSTALVWLWIGQMNLLQGPAASLQAIVVITVILTALLGSIEASHVGAGLPTDKDKNGTKRSGPLVWFFATCLLWVFGFPAWLYARSKYGLKNMIVGGIVVMAVFLGSAVMMGVAIDQQVARARNLLHIPGT